MSRAEDPLETIKSDPDFVDSIITDDKSWCFAYDPLTRAAKYDLNHCVRRNFTSKNWKWLILLLDSIGVV